MAIPSPANPTRKFQQPQRRRRNKACSGESIGRPTSPCASVFLEAIFPRNGKKIYKISSKNNLSVVLFRVDCDYCLDGKRNNRNSTGFIVFTDDVISAYNGGKFNFPWPKENLISRLEVTTQPLLLHNICKSEFCMSAGGVFHKEMQVYFEDRLRHPVLGLVEIYFSLFVVLQL